jgi:hypothetical protein
LNLLLHTLETALATMVDVIPIVVILFVFQAVVIRRKPPNMRRLFIGFFYVLLGLTLFLVGLEEALFPVGKTMADQLTNPSFLFGTSGPLSADFVPRWQDYIWVYVFGAAIGFATAAAEPSLIAVAIKVEQISGGSIRALGLRIAVAIGVAVGVSLGTFRIVTGTPLPFYIMAGYLIVIIQTMWASKLIVPLAYDSGGVTTSTVTVPVLAALGLGLATTIPGRSPLIDGFGLIAFASLFPIMAVMGYASLSELWSRTAKGRGPATSKEDNEKGGGLPETEKRQ